MNPAQIFILAIVNIIADDFGCQNDTVHIFCSINLFCHIFSFSLSFWVHPVYAHISHYFPKTFSILPTFS